MPLILTKAKNGATCDVFAIRTIVLQLLLTRALAMQIDAGPRQSSEEPERPQYFLSSKLILTDRDVDGQVLTPTLTCVNGVNV